ncbi:MAG: hypothetical protein NTX64_04110 [Elusimicrobia bacterium]|nr:hypothetical protein [Elusimicrobiota bacterium]
MHPKGAILCLFLAAAAMFFGACRGQEYWQYRLNATLLHQRSESVRRCDDCIKSVPMEFGSTFPVPVRDGKAERFEVLYFPANFSPSRCVMAAPLYAGRFVLDAPTADRCVSLGVKGPIESLGDCMPHGLSMTQVSRAEARLFETLERLAPLYFKGGPPQPGERKLADEYIAALQALQTPAIMPYYYRQNPDFWEWLRKDGGRSIPKP